MILPAKPKVCVLVLNYRAWRNTIECLESVYSLDYPDFEVVVVDNGSHDQSVEKVLEWTKGKVESQTPRLSPVFDAIRKVDSEIPCTFLDEHGAQLSQTPGNASNPRLTLIASETDWGCYGGFNVGIRWCLKRTDFKYVWILPNDTAVRKDCLSEQVRLAEQNNWGICGARNEYYDEPGTVQSLAGRFNVLSGRNQEITDAAQLDRMDYVAGNAMLVSRQCLDIRLLPEEYFLYFEDLDFCHSARASGVRLGVAVNAVVYHKDGKGSTRMEKEYYWARNLLHFVRKNMPLWLPFSLWYVLVQRVVVKLFNGQIRNIGPLLRGVGDFLKGRFGERV